MRMPEHLSILIANYRLLHRDASAEQAREAVLKAWTEQQAAAERAAAVEAEAKIATGRYQWAPRVDRFTGDPNGEDRVDVAYPMRDPYECGA